MSNEQRKKTFVDPVVQGALCRRMMFHWCMFLAVSVGCSLLLHLLADPFAPFSRHLANMWKNQGPTLLVGLCLLPVFVSDTVKLSHRFAGPLLRIKNDMRRAGTGEHVPLVKLRPHDYWQEFATEFNTVLSRLHEYEEREKHRALEETSAAEPVEV